MPAPLPPAAFPRNPGCTPLAAEEPPPPLGSARGHQDGERKAPRLDQQANVFPPSLLEGEEPGTPPRPRNQSRSVFINFTGQCLWSPLMAKWSRLRGFKGQEARSESQREPGAQSFGAGPKDWGDEGRRVPPCPACPGRHPALYAARLSVPISVPHPGPGCQLPVAALPSPLGVGGSQGPSSQVEPKPQAGWQSCWERMGEPSLPLPAERRGIIKGY